MNSRASVHRGARIIRRVLREQTDDLREVDEAGFRGWLERRLAVWVRDPVFAQRILIRELRRSSPAVPDLEKELRRLTADDAASLQFARLAELEQELTGAERAIAGLTEAVKRAASQRRPELRSKLNTFRARRQSLGAERSNLIRSSPQRQAVLRVEGKLRKARSITGLDREEYRLADLLREAGRRGGRAGQAFERAAVAITTREIVPELSRRGDGFAGGRVHVLQGVKLGAARLEFDQLIVRAPRRSGRPAVVLAAIEVKRNINDLARGFRHRQENLAWLTGENASYDAPAHRTRRFRSGHFDTEATHRHNGETFVFTRASFRLFRRDPDSDLFLNRLYFITRSGSVLGLSSAALGRISYRVATDIRWAPENDAYLRNLWRWCRSLAAPCETPDVLHRYAERRARQILLVGGADHGNQRRQEL